MTHAGGPPDLPMHLVSGLTSPAITTLHQTNSSSDRRSAARNRREPVVEPIASTERTPSEPTVAPRRHRSDRGASLVEYALMISLIAVACIVALSAFGVSNGGSINNSSDKIVLAGS